MQVLSVSEALAMMQAKKEDGKVTVNRFNKKNFNLLMVALANDVDFKSEVAKMKGGELELEEILVTNKFRKWCKKLIEKMGVDKKDAEKVMSPDFVIDDMDGLYDFFTEALYLYMEAGNKFDLPSKKGFQGSLYLKDVEERVTVSEVRNPQTKESLGKYEKKTKAHKELKVKSSCPSYLSEKRKV